jgi:hypothetical protein
VNPLLEPSRQLRCAIREMVYEHVCFMRPGPQRQAAAAAEHQRLTGEAWAEIGRRRAMLGAQAAIEAEQAP